MASGTKITDLVLNMAMPIANDNGCTIYDVEYKKEGSDYVLRVILDTEDDSPISITMCENVSRALSEELDKNDPTNSAYVLEVTSPGIDRPLKKDADFVRFAGKIVEVGLYKQMNGSKVITGELKGLQEDNVVLVCNGEELSIKREETSFVRLAVIF